jgi:hypothetical protein
MNKFYMAVLSLVFMGIVFGCSKSYTLAPIPVPTPTFTPTATNTPCGYPGLLCTPTFTPTSTYTPTITFTPTQTWTPTPTPPPLNTPQGVLGWLDTTTGYPNIMWQSDPSAAVTAYEVWFSNSASGPFSDALTIAKGVDTTDIKDSLTTFNIYIYVVAIGTQPDSANSVTVHAVSGTTTTGMGSFTMSPSTSPTFTITGTVPGAAFRTYQVTFSYPSCYWFWEDSGPALMSSVNYGYSSTGTTYVPATAIPGSATNLPVTVRTYNSSNWNIDISSTSFTP